MPSFTPKWPPRLASMSDVVLLRPGTPTNRIVRRQIDQASRRLRFLAGRLDGVSYRLRGQQPDPTVSDKQLADRIRSSLGPLEQRLDVPRVHVMAEGHIALLHGEVPTLEDAREIEAAVAAVPGVDGVESYLHVGLIPGDTRPSEGRAVDQPSPARRRLLAATVEAGVEPVVALPVVRAILATLAERLPTGEREHVATHLPADVRPLFEPPRRDHEEALARSLPEFVARVASIARELSPETATAAVRAVLHELRALVPEEAADVAAVLPPELREVWQQPATTAS